MIYNYKDILFNSNRMLLSTMNIIFLNIKLDVFSEGKQLKSSLWLEWTKFCIVTLYDLSK